MSIETLVARIHSERCRQSFDIYVAIAAIGDFLRSLHEVFTKCGRHQSNMVAQFQMVLGSNSASHLRRLIRAEDLVVKNYAADESCPLSDALSTLCRQRGLEPDDTKALFRCFFKALDEERYDRDGNCESPTFMVYWSVGQEAAYHFGGLFVGDDGLEVSTEMQYLDYRLKRFRTVVERWEMELAWDKEDEE